MCFYQTSGINEGYINAVTSVFPRKMVFGVFILQDSVKILVICGVQNKRVLDMMKHIYELYIL